MEKKTASPYEPPKAIIALENELKEIGGWLILVGLMATLSPLHIFVKLFPVCLKMFSDGSWDLLVLRRLPWSLTLCEVEA
ncbi:MAG: DUF2569 domain-containing protein [Candidatus Accumulibacter sp.]|jgi:hypothetical protein|nr:DUF2569 domain-containing protein [Accumulibacter sp.]